jgi:hypothetical protein
VRKVIENFLPINVLLSGQYRYFLLEFLFFLSPKLFDIVLQKFTGLILCIGYLFTDLHLLVSIGCIWCLLLDFFYWTLCGFLIKLFLLDSLLDPYFGILAHLLVSLLVFIYWFILLV